MQAGAAADEHHPVQVGDLLGREGKIGQVHPPGLEIDPLPHGAGHRLGLLHDLFQHEMLVSGLVHQHLFLGDHPWLLVDVVPLQVLVLNPTPGDHHHLTALQERHLAHVGLGLEQGQQCRQVAADDRLPIRLGHHQATGMPQPQGADLSRISLQHRGDRLRALDQAAHAPEGFLEAQAPVHPLFDQMGEHFAVGLRTEDMAGVQQPALQLQVVLDDAVVDHGDALLTVGMGMGVRVGRSAVGGPAGVAQSHGAAGVGSILSSVQAVHLAHGLPHLDVPLTVDDGDPGAIVAPVLQALQPLKYDGPGFLPPNVSDYAAHRPSPLR